MEIEIGTFTSDKLYLSFCDLIKLIIGKTINTDKHGNKKAINIKRRGIK